jgi:hypothetical protein
VPKAELKTKATSASVDDYIASRADELQYDDCQALMALFKKLTKQKPKMWGPSIVGYGSYRYSDKHSGEMPVAAFAIRGRDLVVYLMPGGRKQKSLLSRLGKHKMGVSCLYFRRLSDLDRSVLEQLVVESMSEAKRR